MPKSNYQYCKKCIHFRNTNVVISCENKNTADLTKVLENLSFGLNNNWEVINGYACNLSNFTSQLFKSNSFNDFIPFEIPDKCPYLLELLLKEQS